MRARNPHIPFLCLLGWLLLTASPLRAEGDGVLDRVIYMSKSKGNIYKLLGQVSDCSGFLFIYDSHIIDNNKKAKIAEGEYTIRQVIYQITGNPKLQFRVIGKHILISLEETKESAKPEIDVQSSVLDAPKTTLSVEGIIIDRYSNEPIPFATIGIISESIGTITNQNGEFRFLFPDSLQNAVIQLSHIGYNSLEIEASLLVNKHHRLSLEPKVMPLQEVVVRLVNPEKLLEDMIQKRELNYADKPVYHTTFYREGIAHKKELLSLTEAVFSIHKTPYDMERIDQVKMHKMRRIVNKQERDTLSTKFKSGIHACLMLDIIKHLPSFLTKEEFPLFDYAHADIIVMDDRLVNVVSFQQRRHINDPLYRGELYIDTDNSALVSARFEINPQFIEKATGIYVERKSRHLSITPYKVVYTVSYKSWNGIYYINHIRGDLYFRVKKKRKLFTTNLHTWFEMVTCKTETEEVHRFARNETIPVRTVFSETNFSYDEGFWENFNTILPEEDLSKSISKISAVIEENVVELK